jgi:hypothetical protein
MHAFPPAMISKARRRVYSTTFTISNIICTRTCRITVGPSWLAGSIRISLALDCVR